MPAPKKNQNARKDDPKSAQIILRVTPSEKVQVAKAAKGQTVATYIRKKLGLKTTAPKVEK